MITFPIHASRFEHIPPWWQSVPHRPLNSPINLLIISAKSLNDTNSNIGRTASSMRTLIVSVSSIFLIVAASGSLDADLVDKLLEPTFLTAESLHSDEESTDVVSDVEAVEAKRALDAEAVEAKRALDAEAVEAKRAWDAEAVEAKRAGARAAGARAVGVDVKCVGAPEVKCVGAPEVKCVGAPEVKCVGAPEVKCAGAPGASDGNAEAKAVAAPGARAQGAGAKFAGAETFGEMENAET
jgi:hypothetical protein